MKKLIPICLCLFILTACAQKPMASPEEVNRYLDTFCYQVEDVGEYGYSEG